MDSFSYQFDTLNRLQSASLLSPTAVSLAYYDNGNVQQQTQANGTTSAYQYAANGPLKQVDVNGGVLDQRVYTYDANRNVDTITSLLGTHDYGYDNLNRLTQALHPVGSGLSPEDFAYDAVGNREDTVDPLLWEYDTNNRLNPSPSTTYAYDSDGNQTQRQVGAITETFTYDHENRLSQYSDGTTTTDYMYDPFGRRLTKTSNGITTWYWWDGNRLLAEYDNSGNVLKRYAYLPGQYVPTQMADANGTYTVHSDHLATPKKLTDSTGAVVWSAEHSAYGEAVLNEDVDNNGTSVTFNIRYPGQYYDSETNLHYNYYRYYDPRTGRYVTADPIGLNGGINLYGYAGGNPLYWIDPYGLSATTVPGFPIPIPIPSSTTLPALPDGHEYTWGIPSNDWEGSSSDDGYFTPDTTPNAPYDYYDPSTIPNIPYDYDKPYRDEEPEADAPGCPTAEDGYVPPKKWDGKKVKNPNGKGKGFPAKDGKVWVPTGNAGSLPGTTGPAHGGPHWDVQDPKTGGHVNVYPGGLRR